MTKLTSTIVTTVTPWSAMDELRPPSFVQKEKKKGDLKPINAFKNTVLEFAGSTTIHGIGYIFDTAIFIIERLLWFAVVCAFTALAIYWSYDAWKTWQDSPVLTSVKSTGMYG